MTAAGTKGDSNHGHHSREGSSSSGGGGGEHGSDVRHGGPVVVEMKGSGDGSESTSTSRAGHGSEANSSGSPCSSSSEGDGSGPLRGEAAASSGVQATWRQRKTLIIIAAGIFLDNISLSMIAPLLPSFARILSTKEKQISSLLGLRSFVSGITALILPCINLVSILGIRFSLSLALLLSLATFALFALPYAVPLFTSALVLQGICNQLFRTSALSYATKLFVPLLPSSSASSGQQEAQQGEAAATAEASGEKAEREGQQRDTLRSSTAAEGAPSPFQSEHQQQVRKLPGSSGSPRGSAFSFRQKPPLPSMISFLSTVGIILGWAALGCILGPIAGSAMFEYIAAWAPFAALAVIALLLLLAIFVFLPSRGRSRRREEQAEARGSLVKPKELVLPSSAKSPHHIEEAYAEGKETSGMGEEEGGRGSGEDQRGADFKMQTEAMETPLPYRSSQADRQFPPPLLQQQQQQGRASSSRRKTHPLPLVTEGDVSSGLSNSSSKKVACRRSVLHVWFILCSDRWAGSALILSFIQTMAWGALEVTLPFYLDNVCRTDAVMIGLIVAVNGVVYTCLAWTITPIIARCGTPLAMLLGLVLLIVTFPLLVLPDISCGATWQFIMMGVNGIGFVLVDFPAFPSVAEALHLRFSFDEFTVGLGLFNAVYILGYALGPLLVSFLGIWLRALGKMVVVSALLVVVAPVIVWGSV